MTITIFRNNVTHKLAAFYNDEINSIMCMVEGFCYINKIPYSFKNPVIMPDKTMQSFIKLRHKAFATMDSELSTYIVEAVICEMPSDILVTVHDD